MKDSRSQTTFEEKPHNYDGLLPWGPITFGCRATTSRLFYSNLLPMRHVLKCPGTVRDAESESEMQQDSLMRLGI